MRYLFVTFRVLKNRRIKQRNISETQSYYHSHSDIDGSIGQTFGYPIEDGVLNPCEFGFQIIEDFLIHVLCVLCLQIYEF